jgi:hypothetical protein
MDDATDASSVLYYPFSRCIDISALKQMLLLFESIAFCDPVDDETWRAELFRQIEREDPRFTRYRALSDAIPILLDGGVVKRIDPSNVAKIHDEVTIQAILSDMSDGAWADLASLPQKYSLPTQRDPNTGKPSWNIFRPKLPDAFVARLTNDPALREHLFHEGGSRSAWLLSYVAGSAVGINTHLAVAHEYGLAPVTDSSLHHQLMLMKMGRTPKKNKMTFAATDELADLLTRQTIIKVMQKWLSQDALALLSIEDILKFREESQTTRKQFFSETRQEIEKRITGATSKQIEKIITATSDTIVKQAKTYQQSMEVLSDKLWPTLVSAIGSRTTLGGLGIALGASMILSPAQMLIASIPVFLEPAKALLRWNVDRRTLQRKASASVAFLSSVARQE